MKLDIPAQKLIERGYCCGIGCYMCPYDPPHLKKNNGLEILVNQLEKVVTQNLA